MTSRDTKNTAEFVPFHRGAEPVARELCCGGVGRLVSNGTPLPRPLELGGGDEWVLFLLRQGSASLSFQEELLSLPGPSAYLAPPGRCLRLRELSGDSEANWLLLSGRLPDQFLGELLADPGPFLPLPAGCALLRSVHRICDGIDLGLAPDAIYAAVEGWRVLLELTRAAAMEDPAQSYPPLVSEALQIMQKEYAHLYGMEELAERLGISKSYLIRLFSQHVGQSPGKYLMNLRIEEAKLLLATGEYSVEAVADLTGFSDSNYFGKAFRRHTGQTPSQYQRSLPPAARQSGAAIREEGYLY